MEVARACGDCAAMEAFWADLFGAEVLFRGEVGGDRFVRLRACGITLVFTESPDFAAPAGPGEERSFRDHVGLRVDDLDAAIRHLEGLGARFVVTPELVARWLASGGDVPFFRTEYIAPPLTRARIDAGEYRHRVAILVGPDNLWVELNEVTEPADTRWYP